MEELKQQLIEILGKDKAEEVLRLQKNMDLYMNRFKKEMNELLKEHNYEVLCGVAYKERDV